MGSSLSPAFAFLSFTLDVLDGADVLELDVPHVYGSLPVLASWDAGNAVPLQRASLTSWELDCVIPSSPESFDVKFLVKHEERAVFEDDVHIVTGGRSSMHVKIRAPAGCISFEASAVVEQVCPFALGTCWKRCKRIQSQPAFECGLPTPLSLLKTEMQYEADLTETPRDVHRSAHSSPNSDAQASPKVFRLGSDVSVLNGSPGDMPAASGAVAAGAVSEMLGPKERRRLAIVLVGLPARGKTFTAAKLTRYLRWLGHDTKHFNVGKYRRLKHGCTQNADFFRADNKKGIEARDQVATLAMQDMLAWMEEGGQVGIFDATNSTRLRRKMLLKMAEGRCQVIFLETICSDPAVIDHNIRQKISKSPDYRDQPDCEAALADFKARLVNYAKAYEPVDEGSYIKMIDMFSDGQMQVNNISGYLPGRIVFFLVNAHLKPRPILLTRHGESIFNLDGRIGGDPALSEAGERYATKLAKFVSKRLKAQQAASIWTSTLQRTILTARHISGFPQVQWRALDEIDAGVCDGMTYEEIKQAMLEEYLARKLDKLRYRYPRGESYLDVIQRLEPVIVELERQRSPVVVIAHQAILRSLYAYFTDKPLGEIPHIEIPLHTIIEIQMGVAGVQERRYKLMEDDCSLLS